MKNFSVFLTALFFLFSISHAKAQEVADSVLVNGEISTFNLPTVSPYFFQHQFLSVIAAEVPEEAGSGLFNSPNQLNSYVPFVNGFKSPFADSDIKVETFEDEGKKIYVWQFPETQYLREALYMAFIPVHGKYVAYVICIGQEVDWEISKSTQQMRNTFGRVKKPNSAKECVEILKKRGAFSGIVSPGEFFQEGYKSPSYRPQE